jgi:hypothetical protein
MRHEDAVQVNKKMSKLGEVEDDKKRGRKWKLMEFELIIRFRAINCTEIEDGWAGVLTGKR